MFSIECALSQKYELLHHVKLIGVLLMCAYPRYIDYYGTMQLCIDYQVPLYCCRYIALKIGMHSGPVVASVVGTSNPRYCLFGDTVNTASRMQGSCLSNRTQMSHQSAQSAMKNDSRLRYNIKARPGMQNLKGKGPTRTFWLEHVSVSHVTAGFALANSKAHPQ